MYSVADVVGAIDIGVLGGKWTLFLWARENIYCPINVAHSASYTHSPCFSYLEGARLIISYESVSYELLIFRPPCTLGAQTLYPAGSFHGLHKSAESCPYIRHPFIPDRVPTECCVDDRGSFRSNTNYEGQLSTYRASVPGSLRGMLMPFSATTPTPFFFDMSPFTPRFKAFVPLLYVTDDAFHEAVLSLLS